MGKGPSDMSIGDSFEVEYEGHTIEITYAVKQGLYDGDGDRYHFKAEVKDGEGEATAGFHFWRSHSRVAKIAAKRAIKNHRRQKDQTKTEQIKSAFQ